MISDLQLDNCYSADDDDDVGGGACPSAASLPMLPFELDGASRSSDDLHCSLILHRPPLYNDVVADGFGGVLLLPYQSLLRRSRRVVVLQVQRLERRLHSKFIWAVTKSPTFIFSREHLT